jgi:hypothetical protein
MALHNTEELKAGPTSQLEFEVLNDQNQTYEFPAASSAPYMPPRRRTSGAKQAAEKTSDLRLGFASSRFSGHCFATKAVFWPFFGARGREFLTEETPLLGAYAATGMSLLMRTKL